MFTLNNQQMFQVISTILEFNPINVRQDLRLSVMMKMNPAALSCPSAALFPSRKAQEQHSEAPSLKNQHQPNASSVNVSPKCFRRLPPEYFFLFISSQLSAPGWWRSTSQFWGLWEREICLLQRSAGAELGNTLCNVYLVLQKSCEGSRLKTLWRDSAGSEQKNHQQTSLPAAVIIFYLPLSVVLNKLPNQSHIFAFTPHFLDLF